MEQAISQQRAMSILHLQGRFDVHSVSSFQAWVEQELAHQYNHFLLIDLEQVNFVDMAALTAFAEATQRSRQQQGDLVLYNLQPVVQIILDLTRFDAQLTTFSTLEEAMKVLSYSEAREAREAVLAV